MKKNILHTPPTFSQSTDKSGDTYRPKNFIFDRRGAAALSDEDILDSYSFFTFDCNIIYRYTFTHIDLNIPIV